MLGTCVLILRLLSIRHRERCPFHLLKIQFYDEISLQEKGTSIFVRVGFF